MSWGTLFFYTGLLWLIVFVAGDHPHHFSSFFAVCVLIIAWELFCAWRSFCIKPVYHLVLVNAYVGIKKTYLHFLFFIMILYHYFLKVYRIKNTLSNRGVYQKNEHNCLWMLVSKYFHTFFIVRPEETRRHRVRHQ